MAGPDDLYEEGPRSIFAATWFRVLLVVIVFAVIGAVAVPYILDYMNPPAKPQVVSPKAPIPAARPEATAPAPTVPTPVTPTPSPTQPSMPAQPSMPTQPSTPAQPTPQTAMPAQKPAPATPAKPPAVAQSPAPAQSPVSEAPKAEAKGSGKTAAATKPAPKRVAAKAAPSGGSYWVQLGAFRKEDTAKQLAAKLGQDNVVVTSSKGAETSPASAATTKAMPEAPAGADTYDVYVSGTSTAEVNQRLAAKGLAFEPAGNAVVIRPALPLRDAVALSKDLAVEGFKVQVRRAGGAPSRKAAAVPPAMPSSGDTLYRVRVGPYGYRAAAVAALHDLEAKGHNGFIARGEP